MEILTFEGNVMRVDREFYINKFESSVKETYKQNPEFKDSVDSGNYELMERIIREYLFNKPEDYFNMETIRNGYQSDRRISLWEVLDKIFGRIARFKTKDEIAQDEFAKFVVHGDVPPDIYYEVQEFFKSYLLDEGFRTIINKREINRLADNPEMMNALRQIKNDGIKHITDYVKDNVNINVFL